MNEYIFLFCKQVPNEHPKYFHWVIKAVNLFNAEEQFHERDGNPVSDILIILRREQQSFVISYINPIVEDA